MGDVDLTRCPECGAPAEIWDRHVLESTDGPIEHVRVRCVTSHLLFMPAAGLADPVRWTSTGGRPPDVLLAPATRRPTQRAAGESGRPAGHELRTPGSAGVHRASGST